MKMQNLRWLKISGLRIRYLDKKPNKIVLSPESFCKHKANIENLTGISCLSEVHMTNNIALAVDLQRINKEWSPRLKIFKLRDF